MQQIVSKEEARKKGLQKRDAIGKAEREELSAKIIQTLLQSPKYQCADKILSFVSFRSEVETRGLLEQALQDGKAVYCPRVQGTEMEFYRIDRLQDLQPGYQRIPEPVGCVTPWSMLPGDFVKGIEATGISLNEESTCLLIMPGLAFDKKGNRCGYGGGFYDKYVARHPYMDSIGIAFECQIFDEIQTDKMDRKPAMIITEKNIYHIAKGGR